MRRSKRIGAFLALAALLAAAGAWPRAVRAADEPSAPAKKTPRTFT